MIQLLDQNTIDKIAAGEVVERPSAIVKELVENSIDSGAHSITVEIKEGGISFIRITDDGCGIEKEEIPLAFQRHATSKIQKIEDLLQVKSLGFRGEALSSIAAISQVELITKDSDSIVGTRYEIHGGKEIAIEEIGCPNGTTFIVRNVFYNTPARAKFLKSKATEGGYISDVILHFTLSHPEIRFRFIWDGKTKIQTSGNGNLKDNIYHQFGMEVTKALLPVDINENGMRLHGFIGKPELSRGTRSFMNYYINGRHIKSSFLYKAIETAYHGYAMTNRFPFTVLYLEIDSGLLDVNVHPTKMEIRFMNQDEVFELFQSLRNVLSQATLIPEVHIDEKKIKETPDIQKEISQKQEIIHQPEPFETKRVQATAAENTWNKIELPELSSTEVVKEERKPVYSYEQQSIFNADYVKEEQISFRLIGQVFGTFWMVEYENELLIIDQHAAHEKVLYEKIMKDLENKKIYSQNLLTPIILTLSRKEKEVLEQYMSSFEKLGFEIQDFGGNDVSIQAVPSHFLKLANKELFYGILDELIDNPRKDNIEMITDRCATIACKAAVKGNHELSFQEANALIEEMLHAKEPYHCPHGRPTTISMSKKEFEKKFKRIV